MDDETAELLRHMHPQFRLGHAAARQEGGAEIARMRAAVQAFFDASLPPGKHTTTGATVSVSIASMVRLQEAFTVTPSKQEG